MAVDPERHARIVGALADSPLHAVISASPTEVLLLTGYWPVMGASVALFTSYGDVTVLVPEDEVELAGKTSGASIVPYKPGGLGSLSNALECLREPLGRILGNMELSHAVIGVELSESMQPSSYAVSTQFRGSLLHMLKQLQPGAEYAGSDDLMGSLKAVKTAAELKQMQTGSEVAAAGFAKADACIQPGLRETEIAASMQAGFETTDRAKALQRSYGYFYCMSGPNSAKASAAYARTRQRVVEDGDLVMIHANTCADGYWTDITRTYIAGRPTERQTSMRAAIMEAREAALGAIRPGVAACDIDHAARSVMQAHGLGDAFKHATGHGVGFAAANPQGRPRIHPLSPDVLETNMTFNVEPAAYFDGYGGMRHCDLVAVTADGVDVMTKFQG
jgi:Xaa-Pro aminopeptidase